MFGSINICTTFALAKEKQTMRKQLSWQSITLPRLGSRVRVPSSAQLLEKSGCSNGGIGRHEGLKILWPLRLCGFKSRFEYTSLSKHILRKQLSWQSITLPRLGSRVRVPFSARFQKASLFLGIAGLFIFLPFAFATRECVSFKYRAHTDICKIGIEC